MSESDQLRPSYRTITEQKKVLVKIPAIGPNLHWIPSHQIQPAGHDGPITVDGHFIQGLIVKDKEGNNLIVYRHYYAGDSALGQKIVCKVKIVEKTIPAGKTFSLIDIRPMVGETKADFQLKFPEKSNDPDDIPIANSDRKIRFAPFSGKD